MAPSQPPLDDGELRVVRRMIEDYRRRSWLAHEAAARRTAWSGRGRAAVVVVGLVLYAVQLVILLTGRP